MTLATEPFNDYQSAIRAILINDWDPHNAAARPEAHGTYDLYVAPLAEAIRLGASESDIISWLHEREQESMCFPPIGTQRLVRIARKLLAVGSLHYRQ